MEVFEDLVKSYYVKSTPCSFRFDVPCNVCASILSRGHFYLDLATYVSYLRVLVCLKSHKYISRKYSDQLHPGFKSFNKIKFFCSYHQTKRNFSFSLVDHGKFSKSFIKGSSPIELVVQQADLLVILDENM